MRRVRLLQPTEVAESQEKNREAAWPPGFMRDRWRYRIRGYRARALLLTKTYFWFLPLCLSR